MRFFCLLSATLFANGLFADNPNRNFNTSFSGCKEIVAFGPIPFALAQSAIPQGFTAAMIGSAGGIVLRASSCAAVSVAGGRPQSGIVAHYGININSPDGTGDINNYTLFYATTSQELADQLRKTGLPVIYSPGLTFEDPSIRPGQIYSVAFGGAMQPYFLTGTVSDPNAPPFPFLANWWYQSKPGRVKMSTNIPLIAFGPASLTVNTATASPLGALIGGNQKSDFPFYNVRGQFASGVMTVTTR